MGISSILDPPIISEKFDLWACWMSVPSWNGQALACALDFSLACALGFRPLVHWICFGLRHEVFNIEQYCVAGALLACEEGRSRSESGGLSLTCVAPFAETGTPCIVYLLPCLHVAGVTLSSSYITFVWQYECKPLWLNVIILCTCQCSNARRHFGARVKVR